LYQCPDSGQILPRLDWSSLDSQQQSQASWTIDWHTWCDFEIMRSTFFYGLFMDQDLLKGKGLNPRNARPARLPGFGLRIGERASLQESEAELAYGVVMDLDECELEMLYSGDGVEDYVPQTVTVIEMAGESAQAITYVLPMERVAGRNAKYAKALSEMARKLDLPDHYIAEIDTWI
jgi:hypothetical protein